MWSRLVVVAVLAVTAVAAADAVRGDDSTRVVATPRISQATPRPALRPQRSRGFEAVADGRLTRKRVVRNGEEVLSAEQIDAAFPVPFEEAGTFDVADLAVASDGTLAVAVYAFPTAGSARSGIELWKADRLLGAFEVAPGSFAGGIAFTADGRFVAAFDQGQRGVSVFDRSGRRKVFVTLR
jgi:hypothetical protein